MIPESNNSKSCVHFNARIPAFLYYMCIYVYMSLNIITSTNIITILSVLLYTLTS